MKAPSVYGGGAVLDKMSRSDGGDVGLVAAEARGMRAMLGGLDAVMTESPSPSSKTDDGFGDVSRGDGLGVMRTGDCPRIRDLGISSRERCGKRALISRKLSEVQLCYLITSKNAGANVAAERGRWHAIKAVCERMQRLRNPSFWSASLPDSSAGCG